MKLKKLDTFIQLINTERLIHSFKTAIACLIGFFIANIIGLPGDQWIVMTIIVVMCAQLYVGSVVQKSYLRFLGTLIGCIFATIAIIGFGGGNLTIAITIALSSFIFSFIATSQENLAYAGTLGAVTTAIIMLGQQPTVHFAGARFVEISLGIFIAACVSQFILPINAKTHLKRTQAATLNKLRDYYKALITAFHADKITFYEELDENIIKSLTKQRQLAKEASREKLGKLFNQKRFVKVLQCEKEILRATDFMHQALKLIKNSDVLLTLPAFKQFNETILQSFLILIKTIETDKKSSEDYIQLAFLPSLKKELHNNIDLDSEQKIYVDGFLFSVQTLIFYLLELAKLYQIKIVE